MACLSATGGTFHANLDPIMVDSTRPEFPMVAVFFGMHLIGAALGILSFLFMTVLGFIIATWRHDRLAALLFIPYAMWIAFAGVLNGSIFVLN